MIVRLAILAAAAAAATLTSCTPSVTRPTAAATGVTCNTSGPNPVCNIVVRRGTKYRCELGSFDVEPDVLELTGGNPVTIFFRLDPPLSFCAPHDQVFLKPGLAMDYQQQVESFGGEKDDGSRGPARLLMGTCKQTWHWSWSNTGTSYYQYALRFTDTRTGQKCTIDPWVKNG